MDVAKHEHSSPVTKYRERENKRTAIKNHWIKNRVRKNRQKNKAQIVSLSCSLTCSCSSHRHQFIVNKLVIVVVVDGDLVASRVSHHLIRRLHQLVGALGFLIVLVVGGQLIHFAVPPLFRFVQFPQHILFGDQVVRQHLSFGQRVQNLSFQFTQKQRHSAFFLL